LWDIFDLFADFFKCIHLFETDPLRIQQYLLFVPSHLRIHPFETDPLRIQQYLLFRRKLCCKASPFAFTRTLPHNRSFCEGEQRMVEYQGIEAGERGRRPGTSTSTDGTARTTYQTFTGQFRSVRWINWPKWTVKIDSTKHQIRFLRLHQMGRGLICELWFWLRDGQIDTFFYCGAYTHFRCFLLYRRELLPLELRFCKCCQCRFTGTR